MKKIILTAAVLSLSLAYAQKKEVNAAYAAVEANDMATAKTQLSAADAKLNNNLALLEPSALEQYYYVTGMMLLKSGKSAEGAEMLAKISDMGRNKIYTGKNAAKEKVYYVGKEAAAASGIADLKEETYSPGLPAKLGPAINAILQKANKDGLDAYNAKNFKVAGDKFKETYFLLKATGQTDAQYLYNAALSYAYAKDYTSANDLFMQLINAGYTGVETTYTAKNKKTGELVNFDKNTWELSKKDPNYADFKTEKTKSIESELYDTAVSIQMEAKNYDQALATINKGLAKFPDHAALLEQRGKVYYATGKTSEYIENLQNQIKKNPNDAVSWYNLGVLQRDDPATLNDAKNAFLKAAELDPTMKAAYQNLTFLVVGDDKKAIEDYEVQKKAGKMDAANAILKQRKQRFIDAIPYAEKWYALDKTNPDVVSLLKSFYLSSGDEAKAKEFKALETQLLK